MAFSLPLRDLSKEEKSLIRKELIVKKNKSQFNANPELRECFAVNRSSAYIPLGKWDDFYEDFPHSKKDYPRTKVRFLGKLYTKKTDPRGIRDQQVMVSEVITRLKTRHSCLVGAFTGFKKTASLIYLLAWAKMKTVVMVFSDILQKQWMREIHKFTNAKVQLVKHSKHDLDPTADVYIIGVKRASKMNRNKFEDIGMVIFDEAHVATETGFCQTLLKFQPYYLLGATATPRRSDGLHRIFYLYFGPRKEFIIREETGKNFTVVKYKTAYKPEIRYRVVYGKVTLDWTKVQTSIASISERQEDIVNIVLENPGEKILILSDRQAQFKAIHKRLLEEGEESELLIGNKKVWDREKRVLVAGMKKAGVGFDDPNLTMLILASDVKNVRQYEGRLRTDDCLIYDIVDDFKTFESHWRLREKWYLRKGGTIEYKGTDPVEAVTQPSRRRLPPNLKDPSES